MLNCSNLLSTVSYRVSFGWQHFSPPSLAIGSSLSFQRVFYTPTAGGKVYPYLTAIVDVQKGVVKGITWDDACLFCSKGKCEENTYDFNGNLGTQKEYGQPTKGCYIEQPECTAAAAAAAADDAKPICDISVYVVWTGDDADGKALQSSAFRFSAFPEQEIQNRITDNLPDIPSGLLNLVGQGDNDAENGAWRPCCLAGLAEDNSIKYFYWFIANNNSRE